MRSQRRPALHRLAPCLIAGLWLLRPLPAPAAPPCDTIVIPTGIGSSAPATVSSLNPLLSTSLVSNQISRLLLRPLLRLTPAYTIDFSRSLASAIEPRDGNRAFRVTLRPWLWSDGVPVTANDAAYAFDLIRQLGHIYPNYGNGGVPDLVASFTVLDPHRFEIRLTRPVNPDWFALNGLNAIVPLPRHAWGSMTTAQLWARQSDPALFAVSDGPYLLQHFAFGRAISLTPNPRYGGADPATPPAAMPRVVFDFLDGADAFAAFAAGDVDFSNLPYALTGAATAVRDAVLVATRPGFSISTLSLNFASPVAPFLRDRRVRQAMADAIDQPSLIKAIFHGFGTPLYSPVPAAPPTFLSPAASAGSFPVGYNPAQARALLQAAGYTPGPDGIRTQAGHRLSIEALLVAGSDTGPPIAQFVQSNLAAVGIELRIRQLAFNQVAALLGGPPEGWQAAFIGWTINGYPDGQQLYATDGGSNFSHYSDTHMDTLVQAVNFAGDRQPLYAYQDYAASEQPSIFLSDGARPVIARRGIAGVQDFINPDGALYPEALSLTDPNFCHAAHARHAP